jgi:uncharacterized membrane protein
MSRRALAVAVLGSSMVVLALLARDWRGPGWPWLGANLLLAWIPVVLGAVAARGPVSLALVGPAWLVFLPNAPYLLTDLVHLAPRPPVPLWFDVALLGGVGLLGVWMGAVSVGHVADAVRRWCGPAAEHALLVAVPLLCGFGMYLGRTLRWNSWDLALRPLAVLGDLAPLVLDPVRHAEVWAFTATFGGLFLVATLAARPGRGQLVAPSLPAKV